MEDMCFHVIIVFIFFMFHSQEIEMAHHRLLETLKDSSINQEPEDQQCRSATVSRTPSLERSSGDGNFAS